MGNDDTARSWPWKLLVTVQLETFVPSWWRKILLWKSLLFETSTVIDRKSSVTVLNRPHSRLIPTLSIAHFKSLCYYRKEKKGRIYMQICWRWESPACVERRKDDDEDVQQGYSINLPCFLNFISEWKFSITVVNLRNEVCRWNSRRGSFCGCMKFSFTHVFVYTIWFACSISFSATTTYYVEEKRYAEEIHAARCESRFATCNANTAHRTVDSSRILPIRTAENCREDKPYFCPVCTDLE